MPIRYRYVDVAGLFVLTTITGGRATGAFLETIVASNVTGGQATASGLEVLTASNGTGGAASAAGLEVITNYFDDTQGNPGNRISPRLAVVT